MVEEPVRQSLAAQSPCVAVLASACAVAHTHVRLSVPVLHQGAMLQISTVMVGDRCELAYCVG